MTQNLALVFDEVADLYDAARPGYPAELIEAVLSVLQETRKRVLEIGCGTGQATLPFAHAGCRVTALEPGRNLAALAASNLAAFPQAEVQTATFEEWPAAEGQYDLVLSATAFHWVAPEVRYAKSAEALAEGGWLALCWNTEAGDDSVVAQQIQAVYDAHMPPSVHPYATHHPARQRSGVSEWQAEIDQSRLFGPVRVLQFPWTQWYTAEHYLQLLKTYSDHHTLPPETKCAFFKEIAEILTRHGGGRTKSYQAILYLAQVQKAH